MLKTILDKNTMKNSTLQHLYNKMNDAKNGSLLDLDGFNLVDDTQP